MTKDQFVSGVAVLALIVAGVAAFVAFSATGTFAGVAHNQKESFMQGLFAGQGRQLSISNAGVLTSSAAMTVTANASIGAAAGGGVLTIPTSNTATSSIRVGCIQFNATSTATVGHLEFNTQGTTTLNGTSAGSVAWKYGSCPF